MSQWPLRRVSVALVAMILGISASTASPVRYKKLKVFVLVPPEQVLPGVERIAVLDFTGERNTGSIAGRRFTDFVVSQLIEPQRGIGNVTDKSILGIPVTEREGTTFQDGAFTNVFDVIERSRLDQVMSEQSLQASELVDENRAVQFGQLLGVQAIVMGTLNFVTSDRTWTGTSKEKDQYGREYEVNYPCITRTVTSSFRARVVETQTGRILGSKEGSESAKDQACGDSPSTSIATVARSLPSAEGLFNSALTTLAPELVDYITPHFEYREFEFEKITTDDFEDLAKDAAEAAEDLNIDKAYALYWSIYEKDPYNPKVLYNLGVLYEVGGDYDQAREFYQIAYDLRDEGRYEDGLERVAKNVEFAEALRSIGIEITPHTFAVNAADIVAASMTEVEVKGRREDRVAVYVGPSENQGEIARVPGGIVLGITGQEGDWYRVQLPGGKEGYIHKDKVKIKD